MREAEQPSKRSLLYYAPFWILLSAFLVLAIAMPFPSSAVAGQVFSIMGRAMLAALALTLVPIAIGIDSFLTWASRVLIRPVSVGLIGVFILLPFGAVVAQTLMGFWR